MVEFKIDLKDVSLDGYTLTTQENATGKRIDSVTDGVEFVPYWRTIKNDEITIIVNDALRLAILYVSAKHYAQLANNWYDLGTIPDGYRPFENSHR